MSLSEVLAMECEAFEMLWLAVKPIEAREVLVAYTVADFPHLKKERRTKLHKQMVSAAHPQLEDDVHDVQKTTMDFARLLTGAKRGR